MGTGIVQPTFASGEVSPALFGRTDLAQYQNGLKTLRNFIVRKEGGVWNRPGTKMVTECLDSSKKCRLLPFEFNTDQTYVVELGEQTGRVLADGGIVELADVTIGSLGIGEEASFTTGPGAVYLFSCQVEKGPDTPFVDVRVGTTSEGSDLLLFENVDSGALTGTFTATQTVAYVSVSAAKSSSSAKLILHFDDTATTNATGDGDLNNLGGVTVTADQAKFGAKSAYFSGSVDSALTGSDPDYILVSRGTYTIDWWQKGDLTGTVFSLAAGSSANYLSRMRIYWKSALGKKILTVEGSNRSTMAFEMNSSIWHDDVPLSTWCHFAVVKTPTGYLLFEGGVLVASSSAISALEGYWPRITSIGCNVGIPWAPTYSDHLTDAYIDEFRISVVARWSEAFTPPTAAYDVTDFSAACSAVPTALPPFETPWTEDQLPYLNVTQSEDTLIVCHPTVPPQKIERNSGGTFTCSPVDSFAGPFEDVNVDETIQVWAEDGTGRTTLHASQDLFDASDEGTVLYMETYSYHGMGKWEPGKEVATSGENCFGKRIWNAGRLYECVTDSTGLTSGHVYRTGSTPPTHESGTEPDGSGEGISGATSPIVDRQGVDWQYVADAWGSVRIVEATDARTATVDVVRTLPDTMVGTATVTNVLSTTDVTLAVTESNITFDQGSTTGSTSAAFGQSATVTPKTSYVVSMHVHSGWLVPVTGVRPFALRVGTTAGGAEYFEKTFTMGANSTLFVSECVNIYTQSTIYVTVMATLYGQDSGQGIVLDAEWSVNDMVLAIKGTDTHRWARQAWSEVNGYPGCAAFFKQRLYLSGVPTEPRRVWASAINGYFDFTQDIPPKDDKGFSVVLASATANAIRHILPLSELLVLTAGAEHVMSGDQSGSITPATVQASWQGANGTSTVAPMSVGGGALFVPRGGKRIRTMGYDFASDSFGGQDLLVMSAHLVRDKQIVGWCFQALPDPVVWCVLDDGTLASMTYQPDQKMFAWARHDTDGTVEDVCSIPNGDRDDVYMSVLRGGTRYVEMLAQREFADVADAFFVDCGVTYVAPSGPVTTISGLTWLAGRSCAVLADGVDVGPLTVSAGGVLTLAAAASKVTVGLPITADFETLALAVPGQSVGEKAKLVSKVHLMLEDTLGVKVGPDFAHLHAVAKIKGDTVPYTGLVSETVQSRWDVNGRIAVRQDRPLPVAILAAIPEVTLGG